MTTFEQWLESKRASREAAIAKLIDEAKGRGQCADRGLWAMVYDFELAPMTTNRKQLAELGVDVPKGESLNDADLGEQLRIVIDALARLSVYLLHTAHLSDRELYERLEREILDGEVRDLPPADVALEWIDLCLPRSEEEWERYDELYEGKDPWGRDAGLPRPASYAHK